MAKNGDKTPSSIPSTPEKKLDAQGRPIKFDDQGRRLYMVRQVVDGDLYEREVPIIGIPFWIPQKPVKKIDQKSLIVGTIEEIIDPLPSFNPDFPARRGILLSTKDDGFVVVPGVTAVDNAIDDYKLAAGMGILVEFNGIGRDKGNGMKPALRMNVSVCQGKAPEGFMQTKTTTSEHAVTEN